MKTVSRRFCSLAILAFCATLFAGCADTIVRKSWTSPGVTSLKFSKLFIVAMAHNDIDRRLAENTFKAHIPKVPSLVSNDFVPGVLGAGDKTKLLQAIKDNQVDGVIVMRVTSSDTRVVQGASTALAMEYETFSSFYGSVYDVSGFFASDTRATYTDRIYYIETKIYDGKTEKLLWSCTTKSTKNNIEAQNIGALAADVAKTIKDMLGDQKLIR